jgi:hypothetical protein
LALKATYRAQGDHLHVRLRGEFEPASARQIFAEALSECVRSGLHKVVCDARDTSRPLLASEKVLVGFSVEGDYRRYAQTAGEPIRLGMLLPPERISHYQPLREILEALGMGYAVFEDLDELTRWLDAVQEPTVPE